MISAGFGWCLGVIVCFWRFDYVFGVGSVLGCGLGGCAWLLCFVSLLVVGLAGFGDDCCEWVLGLLV